MKDLRDAFSSAVLAELARPVQTYDPRDAEIAPGIDPKWHVWEIASRDVERELIKRRFGTYVPECVETTVRFGRKVERCRPMFPGYVFVFVWPTARNWNKIADIRGVMTSIGSLTDDEIDFIRDSENRDRPITLEYFEQERVVELRKRKRGRRLKGQRRPVMVPDEIIRTRAWSAFDDLIRDLDGVDRSDALRQMLGAAPVA